MATASSAFRMPFGNNSGRATRWLVIALVVGSLLGPLLQRSANFPLDSLAFTVSGVLHGELWRLITYAFVQPSPIGLVGSALGLWFLGSSFEARWGTRDFTRFFFVSVVGAAAMAIPLSWLFNVALPIQDIAEPFGPWTAINAMLVALALTSPDSNVLLGFILPVRVRTVVWFIVGMQVITGIQLGAANLSTTLAGLLMGYLLVTGNWRPARWLGRLGVSRRKSARRGLYVVPPKDQTLH